MRPPCATASGPPGRDAGAASGEAGQLSLRPCHRALARRQAVQAFVPAARAVSTCAQGRGSSRSYRRPQRGCGGGRSRGAFQPVAEEGTARQRLERATAGKRRVFFKAEQFIQRSEEHTSELQSLMRISYAVFCLKKKKKQ